MANNDFIELKKLKAHQRKEKIKRFVARTKSKTQELGRRAKIKLVQHRKTAVEKTEAKIRRREEREEKESKKLSKQITREKKLAKIRGLRKKHLPKAGRIPSVRKTARTIGGPPALGLIEPVNLGFGSSKRKKKKDNDVFNMFKGL